MGSATSRPVLSRLVKLGVSTPLLRRSSRGKVTQGEAMTGSPLNMSRKPRAVPKPPSTSISSSRASSSQSGGSVTQVLKLTSRRPMVLSPLIWMAAAEPRAPRSGSSNPPPRKVTTRPRVSTEASSPKIVTRGSR